MQVLVFGVFVGRHNMKLGAGLGAGENLSESDTVYLSDISKSGLQVRITHANTHVTVLTVLYCKDAMRPRMRRLVFQRYPSQAQTLVLLLCALSRYLILRLHLGHSSLVGNATLHG